MTAPLGLNDNVLELNDHSLITSLCARTMRKCENEPAPDKALCTLRCHGAARHAL